MTEGKPGRSLGLTVEGLDGPQLRLYWLLLLERNRPLLRLAKGVARHQTAFGLEGFGAAEGALDAWWQELLEGEALPTEDAKQHERAVQFLASTDKGDDRRTTAVNSLLMAFLGFAATRIAEPRHEPRPWEIELAIEDVLLMEHDAEPSRSDPPSYVEAYVDLAGGFDPSDAGSLEAARTARTRAAREGLREWSSDLVARMRAG